MKKSKLIKRTIITIVSLYICAFIYSYFAYNITLKKTKEGSDLIHKEYIERTDKNNDGINDDILKKMNSVKIELIEERKKWANSEVGRSVLRDDKTPMTPLTDKMINTYLRNRYLRKDKDY